MKALSKLAKATCLLPESPRATEKSAAKQREVKKDGSKEAKKGL